MAFVFYFWFLSINILLLGAESEDGTTRTVSRTESRKYDHSWAVQLQNSVSENDVRLIANSLGLNYRQVLPGNYYLLTDESSQEAVDKPNSEITEALKSLPQVIWVEQQTMEDNDFRDFDFSDPLWEKQKYLKSDRPSGFSVSHYVEDAWRKGYTGKNVTVAVIDDGVRGTHQDFYGRYVSDQNISVDIVKGSSATRGSHGTKCAGVISAGANNSVCGVGVAYDSRLVGIRLFANLSSTDAQEAQAFYNERINVDRVQIFSNSWGPKDNGYYIRAPGRLAREALKMGTTEGRNGLGSIYLFSAGNGGYAGDSCTFDGYVNSIYTIAVASITENGEVPNYAESCPAIMTAVYSTNLVTVESKNDTDCVEDFGRTSAASAFVAGIIALALEANPSLTWRDVQHLIARSSTWKGVDGKVERVTNAHGFTVGKYFGFGVLDALKMVKKAEKWNVSVSEQVECRMDIVSRLGETQPIPAFIKIKKTDLNCDKKLIKSLEHVQLRVDLNYTIRALLVIDVESPSRTHSRFVYTRPWDALTRATSYSNLVVTSVHFWGEPVEGEWKVNITEDRPSVVKKAGTLFNLTLIFYGTHEVIPRNDSEDNEDDKDEDEGEDEDSNKPSHTQSTSDIPPTPPSSSEDPSKPLKPWAIAVIVIVCLLLVIVLVLAGFYIYQRQSKSTPERNKTRAMKRQYRGC